MRALPLIFHKDHHARCLVVALLAGWLATLESDGAVVPPTQQTATFNHKLDFYFNLNEIINFGIRFN